MTLALAAFALTTLAIGTPAQATDKTRQGCPSRAACLHAPDGRIIYTWWEGVYQLHGIYGNHLINNNQTEGWVVHLCTDYNGQKCLNPAVGVDALEWHDFTPINSVRLEPGRTYWPFCDFIADRVTVKGVDAFLLNKNRGYTPVSGQTPRVCQIGKAQLAFQPDGNLVVYDEVLKARWAASWSRPEVLGGWRDLWFQSDCNLVIYAERFFERPLWESNSPRHEDTDCRLAVQADGNVVIYDGNMNPIWSTGTYH